jgi:tRNA splicing ligase
MVPGSWEGPQYGKPYLHVFILKIKIFSRTSRPISIKLDTNHAWVKGILNCSNKGPDPLQRGDNHKNEVDTFKNLFSPEPQNQNRSYLHESFLI